MEGGIINTTMKEILTIITALLLCLKLNAMEIELNINGKVFTAEIEDTETGRAFCDLLPMTLDMSELNGNEKYHYLMSGLPTEAHYCSTIQAGDLMLYGNSCVVLFYGYAGGYSYTRLGKLLSTQGLAEAVGRGSISVTFSIRSTGVETITSDPSMTGKMYDLQGRELHEEPSKGIFIKNGKKIRK